MLVIMILYLYSILVKCDRYINIQRIRFPTIDHVYIYDLACNGIIRTVGGWDNWCSSKWLNKKIFWSGPGVFWWLEAGMEQPGECNPFFVLKCSTRQKTQFIIYITFVGQIYIYDMEPNHFFCRTGHEPSLSSVFQPPFFFLWVRSRLARILIASAQISQRCCCGTEGVQTRGSVRLFIL